MATAKSKVDGSRQKTGGRSKGIPNKTTALLKDAILKAADQAGGKGGLVAYLQVQAKKNPGPFIGLLGKVLPLQVNAEVGGGFHVTISDKDADCC